MTVFYQEMIKKFFTELLRLMVCFRRKQVTNLDTNPIELTLINICCLLRLLTNSAELAGWSNNLILNHLI